MIYLDNAAGTFPKPAGMSRAVAAAFSDYGANPGRGSYALSRHTARMVEEVREKMAALFQVEDAHRVIFTSGATAALNMAVMGSDLKGGHVICSDLEHNAVLRPLYELERRGDISLTVVKADESGYLHWEDYAAAIRENTKLAVMTHASNVLGTVQPVEAVSRLGIPLLVDASQTVGYLPLAAGDIAMIAFPAHKGLYGPAGIGGLYVKEGYELNPLLMGGTGRESESHFMPKTLPERLEAGSLPTALIAGLSGALDFLREEDGECRRQHGLALINRFMDRTAHLPVKKFWGDGMRVPVLSFVAEGQEPWETAEGLDRLGIAVRSGFHCAPLIHHTLKTEQEGTVRLSPSRFTTERDIDLAALALEKVIRPWRP